jgi:quercetin dioxygenase-like cupin family protein
MASWQTFHVIAGSAGAALIGIQFIVVTLIANIRTLRAAVQCARHPTHSSADLLHARVAGLAVAHGVPVQRLRRSRALEIKRGGSQPSGKGPVEYFTGTVRIDPLFQAPDPARVVGASVTFEPGARTAWHTHPIGQTLIVTAGSGRAQRWGSPVEDIRPGDVIWFPPGEKHWHGAAQTTAVTHIAIQERLDGKTVDWMERVSDDQYGQ